jgi:FixJ family two-component response regulator
VDSDPRIFVVDDDRALLTAIERVLSSSGYRVQTFTSPAFFIEQLPYDDGPACLVLDLRMPELTGLDVQEWLLFKGIAMPTVFLSGAGDVPSTARAMRKGAVDFLVKPVDEGELLAAVSRALATAVESRRRSREAAQSNERLARLTRRERQVCELVARGLLNKQIAYELGASEKTIKVHRGRVMRKLEVGRGAGVVVVAPPHRAVRREPLTIACGSVNRLAVRQAARAPALGRPGAVDRRGDRNHDEERGADVLVGLGPEPAAMILDDEAADGQTDAGSRRFRRVERREELSDVHAVQPDSGIPNADLNVPVHRGAGLHG